jgi:hypothetical protein
MTHAKLLHDFVLTTMLDEAIRLSKNSIDDQVDSILLRFESDCIVGDYDEIDAGIEEASLYYCHGEY